MARKGILETGGSLVLRKRYWGLLVDYQWNQTTAKWTLHSIEATPGDMMIHKLDSEELDTLRHIKPEDAVKTLSVTAQWS